MLNMVGTLEISIYYAAVVREFETITILSDVHYFTRACEITSLLSKQPIHFYSVHLQVYSVYSWHILP